MGYAVDLSLIFHHCLPRPSIEANMIMLQRKGEIGKIHFDFRALFNSFDVMYFVKSHIVICTPEKPTESPLHTIFRHAKILICSCTY